MDLPRTGKWNRLLWIDREAMRVDKKDQIGKEWEEGRESLNNRECRTLNRTSFPPPDEVSSIGVVLI